MIQVSLHLVLLISVIFNLEKEPLISKEETADISSKSTQVSEVYTFTLEAAWMAHCILGVTVLNLTIVYTLDS